MKNVIKVSWSEKEFPVIGFTVLDKNGLQKEKPLLSNLVAVIGHMPGDPSDKLAFVRKEIEDKTLTNWKEITSVK